MKEGRAIEWHEWPAAWEEHLAGRDGRGDPLGARGTKGAMTRVLETVPGVFGVVVQEQLRSVSPMHGYPKAFYGNLNEAREEGIQVESYPCVVVDLQLRPPGWVGSEDWEHWGEGLRMTDLIVFNRVSLVLEDSVPAGVQWVIKQQEEFMGKDGELPTFAELARKVPDIEKGVMRLMEKLDHWTLRSMQVELDEQGRFKSQWDPSLAPSKDDPHRRVVSKPAKLESWTVLLLEFVVPSREAEPFTSLVRSVTKMTSRLGEAGSLHMALEERVRATSQENEEVKWAAAAHREIAERAIELAYDSLVASRSAAVPKVQATDIEEELVRLRATIEAEDTAKRGALYYKRFQEMEKAVTERRPEVAADLLRGLEDD